MHILVFTGCHKHMIIICAISFLYQTCSNYVKSGLQKTVWCCELLIMQMFGSAITIKHYSIKSLCQHPSYLYQDKCMQDYLDSLEKFSSETTLAYSLAHGPLQLQLLEQNYTTLQKSEICAMKNTVDIYIIYSPSCCFKYE